MKIFLLIMFLILIMPFCYSLSDLVIREWIKMINDIKNLWNR